MSKIRNLGVAAVFLAGCAVAGASARFVVPPASAQQAATLTKWDYLCFNEYETEKVQSNAKAAGVEGWEMSASMNHGNCESWCFKRPKM